MPSFATSRLAEELDALSPALRNRLAARGFEARRLLEWAAGLGGDPLARNRLRAEVRRFPEEALDRVPAGDAERARLRALGQAELERGALAVCVLAGGMATRMGGVVKALVELHEGATFLDVRLAERERVGERSGRAPPLWLMTSEPTDAPIRAALEARGAGEGVATFEQHVSLRLTPEGALFRDEAGEPSVHATGHGDLVDALRSSGLLASFVAGGGRHVWISNIDNIGATIDPVILGRHVERAAPLTVELVGKHAGDRGGIPVLADGRAIVAEQIRLPESFDDEATRVFNTNTFLVEARALLGLSAPWTYLEVRKQVGERTAVQFERLLGEMTTMLPAAMLHVEREGPHGRFVPVKDIDELERARALVRERSTLLRPRGASA
jgi:UTP--glucose-1-phosphate uridylyltransferase